jgi:hypothetical protein
MAIRIKTARNPVVLTKSRFIFSLVTLFYATILYVFYIKYVPLIKPFQLIILPLLFLTTLLTSLKVQWGTLLFIFLFPLINNLPYFFGIYENTPHAPTALVLCLFFLLGWLVNHTLFGTKDSFHNPIFKPIIAFSLLVLVSLVITVFRYGNFYPFATDAIYELITNVNGVTSGGAIMSTIFASLNYLTGFAFFFILMNSVKSKEYVQKILKVLLISTCISLFFGFIQHFKDISIGNTPFRVQTNILNSTFKDPLSFGCFLGIMAPLLFAMTLSFNRKMKVIPAISFLGVIFILPFTGSLSGLLGIFFSFLIFLLLLLRKTPELKNSKSRADRKPIMSAVTVLLLVGIIGGSTYLSKDSESFKKLKRRIANLAEIQEWGDSLGNRMSYFWPLAGLMIKDYPISGVGVGAYIIELPNYAALHNKHWRTTDSAENYLLQVGSEMGILGMFLSLWILLVILKQMRSTFKMYSVSEKWNYLIIGIIAGTFSLLANLPFHTFIGSYEIKYTFWLLVGLIFCLSHMEKKHEEKTFFKKNFIIFVILLITIFSVSYLWNSTHSLSLKSRTKQLGIKQNFGLYPTEKTDDGREFNWTKNYGGITIQIEKPVIEIPLHASHPDIRENPVKVKIYLLKNFFKKTQLLDEIIIKTKSWDVFKFHIPEELNQEVILLFKISRTWNPQKVLGVPDPRDLGVAVGKIHFKNNSEIIRDNP